MVIIGYANWMKSEQILMKSIQIILTSFLNQFGLAPVYGHTKSIEDIL